MAAGLSISDISSNSTNSRLMKQWKQSTEKKDSALALIDQCLNFKLHSIGNLWADYREIFTSRVLKVLKTLQTQRKSLVGAVQRFPFSTMSTIAKRKPIADAVGKIVGCLKEADIVLDMVLTYEFDIEVSIDYVDTYPEVIMRNFVANTFKPLKEYINTLSEDCISKIDLGYSKMISKFFTPMESLKKCVPLFDTSNTAFLNDSNDVFRTIAKKVNEVITAVKTCSWSLSSNVESCAAKIVSAADPAICDSV